jgi:hypothetical protein
MPTEPLQAIASSSGSQDVLSGALSALLLLPELTERLRRAIELGNAADQRTEPDPLPKEVRPGIRQLAAVLALSPLLSEVLKLSEALDFRDLKEAEIAYLEEVHVKTIRRWRMDGSGPEYRNHGSIRYPIRLYWEWRERGRQRMTAQKATKGKRP